MGNHLHVLYIASWQVISFQPECKHHLPNTKTLTRVRVRVRIRHVSESWVWVRVRDHGYGYAISYPGTGMGTGTTSLYKRGGGEVIISMFFT